MEPLTGTGAGADGEAAEDMLVEPEGSEANPAAEHAEPAKRRPWSADEDEDLKQLVGEPGIKSWVVIATRMRARNSKQCRERWHSHLRPTLTKGEWTPEEDQEIWDRVQEMGTKWAQISAQYMPSRTDNDIKNRWNSTVRKSHAPGGREWLAHPPQPYLLEHELRMAAELAASRAAPPAAAQAQPAPPAPPAGATIPHAPSSAVSPASAAAPPVHKASAFGFGTIRAGADGRSTWVCELEKTHSAQGASLWVLVSAPADSGGGSSSSGGHRALGAAHEQAAAGCSTAASSPEHAALVERLDAHMTRHGLTQGQVAKAAKVSSGGALSSWFGRGIGRLKAETEAENDALIAAYLDGDAEAAAERVPPGWREQQKESLAGRKYSVYHGPNGEIGHSMVAAWRLHNDAVDGVAATSRAHGQHAPTSVPQPDTLPDGSYAVSHLVAERHLGARRQFRVRWVGYSSADDTWENAKDILTPVLIEHFERLRDRCEGSVRTALRQQLHSLGAQREQHEQLLGAAGAAWLHKTADTASSERDDDSKVATAMRHWLSEQWSKEGEQQPVRKRQKRPDEDFWVACDRCGKWRRLYLRGNRQVGGRWYCEQNPDPLHDDCSYEQEEMGEDEGEDEAEQTGAMQLTSCASTSNAAGKRPRVSEPEAPPGCAPPSVRASNFGEDYQMRSADGSIWKVESFFRKYPSGHIGGDRKVQFRWAYVPAESTGRRPLAGIRQESTSKTEQAPCRHCGKLCALTGSGLMQHEAVCAHRPRDSDLGAMQLTNLASTSNAAGKRPRDTDREELAQQGIEMRWAPCATPQRADEPKPREGRKRFPDKVVSATRLHDGLERIMSEYDWTNKREAFGKDHHWMQMLDSVELGLQRSVGETYAVRSSMGCGGWAKVPWIAVSHPTESTQHGLYLQYLFRADMSGVYLCLGQGTTKLKAAFGQSAANQHLAHVGEFVRAKCKTLLGDDGGATGFDLSGTKIDLRTVGASPLAESYEKGAIVSKLYARGEVPSEDDLLEGLQLMLTAYAAVLEDPQYLSEIKEPSDARLVAAGGVPGAGKRARVSLEEPGGGGPVSLGLPEGRPISFRFPIAHVAESTGSRPLAEQSTPGHTAEKAAKGSSRHERLVERLKEHMSEKRLSQVQLAAAVGLSSSSRVCMWLGNAQSTVSAASVAEIDGLIAAYLDREAASGAATSSAAASAGAPIPLAPSSAASAASATSAAPAARPAAEVVAEKDGLRLHLNPASNSGYKGVHFIASSSKYHVNKYQNRTNKFIGNADTALDGAVMYARSVGPAPPPSAGAPRTLEGDNCHEDEDEQAAAGCSTAATTASTPEHAALVERLEAHMARYGLSQVQVARELMLSSSSAISMWLGRASSRLSAAGEAEKDALIAAYLHRPRLLPANQPLPPSKRFRGDQCGLLPGPVRAEVSVEIGSDSDPVVRLELCPRGPTPHAAEGAPAKRPVEEVVAEKDGLRLHLNPASSSGYKGVHYNTNISKYHVYKYQNRSNKSIGTADTALDGAVMYARSVGPAPPPSAGAPRTLEGDNDHEDEDEQAAAGCSTAATAATAASAPEHAALVERLEAHMARYGLSQVQVAKALKLSSSSYISVWLGRSSSRLTATAEAEKDALIASYLDRAEVAGPARAEVSVETGSDGEPVVRLELCPHDHATAASAPEHAALVERLEAHMARYGLSQVQVARELMLTSSGIISMWLGRASSRLSAASEAEKDALIAAYLHGGGVPVEATTERSFPNRVRWYNGVELIWSDTGTTGYRGVTKVSGQELFRALRPATFTELGRFPSAEEAALCYANHVRSTAPGPAAEEVEDDDDDDDNDDDDDEDDDDDDDYSEWTAEILPVASEWLTVRAPPAAPPTCACGTSCVWLRRRWFCARDEGGCGFESEAPPEPAPLTPLCRCARPCKWLLGRWWCAAHLQGGCGFEHMPTAPAEPARVAEGAIEAEMARGSAAMLTAAAFGLDDWCFVAPSDCGLGLFARSALAKGQQICEYDGPRLPLQELVNGEYALEIPRTGLFIDGARANCPLACAAPPSCTIYANHSTRPNARLLHVPASGDAQHVLLLVATERIRAGSEIRFDYELGGRRGTYWGSRGPPAETRWRDVLLPAPPPACREPIFQGTAPSAPLAAGRASAAAGSLLVGAKRRHDTIGGGGGGDDDDDAGDGVSSSRLVAASAPVAWDGPRGGDAVLTAVIGLLKRSPWSEQCAQKADGKAQMWQLVATHLPGRTATECQERWRQLCRDSSTSINLD